MSVYKDKRTGSWCYKFVKDGIQYHKCFKGAEKKDVENYETRLKSDILQNKYDIHKKNNKSLKQVAEEYKEYCKTNYVTKNKFDYVIDIFLRITGNKPVEQITEYDIERYKTFRSGLIANSSINRELNVLSKMFSLQIESRTLKYNPCFLVKKLRETQHADRFLSSEEEEKLLECANSNLRLIILTALHTGMRQGEILNLKWEDINLNLKYIKVVKTKSNKTRKIPLSKKLAKEFLKQTRISEYVFTNPQTKKRYVNIQKVFSETVKRAKIEKITFHQLRHTAATRMVEQGIDLVVVKEILGHADLTMTQRYSHPVPKRILEAINVLENYTSKNSRKTKKAKTEQQTKQSK